MSLISVIVYKWLQCTFVCIFFFIDTATTEIYTLSLHDALPILHDVAIVADAIAALDRLLPMATDPKVVQAIDQAAVARSEEHTSELQSHSDLVCRLLLEKKKEKKSTKHTYYRTNQVTQYQRYTQ